MLSFSARSWTGRFLMVPSLLVYPALLVLLVGMPSVSYAADEAVVVVDDDHEHGEVMDAVVDHGGHGHSAEAGVPPLLQFDFGSAICNLAIFLGVLAILSKFVWPVILGGLQAREEKIHGELEAAARANADAKALLADYQVQINEASTKVQSMLAEARKDSEASAARIVEEAKAEAERQRERALSDIETAKKVALSDLAGQTSDMAISVAKAVVGRELNASDHQDLT
jgi:F-type H+-transporting ATPase subunit b